MMSEKTTKNPKQFTEKKKRFLGKNVREKAAKKPDRERERDIVGSVQCRQQSQTSPAEPTIDIIWEFILFLQFASVQIYKLF